MHSLFGDLTVLDLSAGIAGPLAAMTFADHGADVIRIEAPECNSFPALDGNKVWNRGKRSAILDLDDVGDRALFLALAANADVLIESEPPGQMAARGLDYATISALNPRLIYCSITGYGRDSRHSDRPAHDQLVAARTGLQWEARGWYGSPMDRIKGRDRPTAAKQVTEAIRIGADRKGPIFTASPAASTIAAYQAMLGISAALRARDVTGRGQWVETSLYQAVLGMSCATWQRPEKDEIPGYSMDVTERRQTWGLVSAKDDFMCMWVSPPRWFTLAGAGHTLIDPGAPQPGMMSIEKRLEQLEEAAPIFRKFTVEEWCRIAAENGNISCQPVRTPEQALTDPALLSEGSVVKVEDAELGTLHQAGAVYRLHDRPINVRWGAPARGAHNDEVRKQAEALKGRPALTPGTSVCTLAQGPLDGIRIIDFGAAVAGPWATQLLADMGANVIKVDPARQTFWMQTHMAMAVNRSKRWMGLDAKTPEGQEIARTLIEGADVVMLNLRPQAAKKLGFDYDTVSRINPRIIYCSTRGFEDGPRSQLPGNDQTANSLGGTTWEDGGCWEEVGRPWFGATSNGDLGNGYLAAIGIVQALYDRERTGKGQNVDASILNASLVNNSRVYTDPQGTEFDRPKLDAGQTGLSALYRIYKCADEWICLAAFTEAEWTALASAIPALKGDQRFATAEARAKNDVELTALLRTIFPQENARNWFTRLDAAGVPCEISDPHFSQQLFDDKELIDRKWVVRKEGNPNTGTIDMFGRLIDFSATPSEPGGPPPVLWQHGREILREIGYSDQDIDRLAANGAVILPQESRALA
jgi:crotonobetainyl-CoA:carnitine CoA-transferase CaiB-like acyl-CoA transferase